MSLDLFPVGFVAARRVLGGSHLDGNRHDPRISHEGRRGGGVAGARAAGAVLGRGRRICWRARRGGSWVAGTAAAAGVAALCNCCNCFCASRRPRHPNLAPRHPPKAQAAWMGKLQERYDYSAAVYFPEGRRHEALPTEGGINEKNSFCGGALPGGTAALCRRAAACHAACCRCPSPCL